MTAITPQQMRELADVLAGYHSWKDVRNGSAALRTAADQLDAVPAQRDAFLDSPNLDPVWVAGWHAAIDHVTHSITADTAPQEDRDE